MTYQRYPITQQAIVENFFREKEGPIIDINLLGVDIGTYSSKGVLVDGSSGKVVATHTIEHGLSMPKPGWVEHDAEEIWWGEFVKICQKLLQQSQVDAKSIRGIGISGIGNCVLPIDPEGTPLRPGILYGIDTRAKDEIQLLERELGKEQIFKVSATHLSSSAAGPKILWIKNNEPEIYDKASWFLNSHSFVIFRLTGNATVDTYTACGYAPLIDVAKGEWHESAAKLIVPMDKLPKIIPSCAIAGKVTAKAARLTGLAEGTPVVGGAIDAGAEAISAGVRDHGDMMIMLGSSNSLILITDQLVRTEHFWGLNWITPGSYAVVGGMATVGSLTRWFRDHFSPMELDIQNKGGENAYQNLTQLLDISPPGANGLIALPYFEGERTPFYDPDAKGVLFGLNLKHSRADIYRALLESVGFGIRHNLESLKQEELDPKRFIVIGGGTKNQKWLQIISNIAGIEMLVPSKQMGSCFGDAMMAAAGVGIFKNLSDSEQWISYSQKIIPQKEYQSTYSSLYEIYRDLYKNTNHLMKRISAIQRNQSGKFE